MDTKEHWQHIYTTKQPDELSWFQREARLSLDLILHVARARHARVLDVGGGASPLVDGLLAEGFTDVTVLDLAPAALEQSRHRLGEAASRVRWIEADVLTYDFPSHSFDVWHDRAVFHFLTDVGDRARYVAQVRRTVSPGGYILVATFADDGPNRCSGLPVARYSAERLHAEFGAEFKLEDACRESHATPAGAPQAFIYCLCRIDG